MPYKDPADRQAYFERTLEHRREVHRLWVQRNREHRKAYMTTYQAEHRQQIRDGNHRRYHANPERTKAQNHAKYWKDPEKARAEVRARRVADPVKARANDRARRQQHGTHIDAMARARRIANPEPLRSSDRKRYGTVKRKAQAATARNRRRAHKSRAARNDLTAAQWLEIQALQHYRCYYCGRRCKGHLTQDHIQPLSLGGAHTAQNIIGACTSCNSRKGTKPPPIPVQPLLLTVAPSKKRKT